jgi:hypothetical protein
MKRQSYKDGWIPGYIFNMVQSRPGYPLSDPPIVLDRNAPVARQDPATETR